MSAKSREPARGGRAEPGAQPRVRSLLAWDATIGAGRCYPVCTVAANLNQRRALNLADRSVALGYVTQYTDNGYQHYNGLLLSSRLRLGDYLNLNANYTLSKCEGIRVAPASCSTPGRTHSPAVSEQRTG